MVLTGPCCSIKASSTTPPVIAWRLLTLRARATSFTGPFIFGLLQGWAWEKNLDFCNAFAALNCTAIGARGSIRTQVEAEVLMERGSRNVNEEYGAPASVPESSGPPTQ